MPQAANIVLTDGITPKTFTPKTIRPGGESTFHDMSAGSKALAAKLTISNRTGGNDSEVVRLKIDLPHLVTNADTGVTEVVEESLVDIRIRHAAASDDAFRDYLVELAMNSLASSQSVLGPVLRGEESVY